MDKRILINFNLDKIKMKAETASETNFHQFKYEVNVETLGTGTPRQSVRVNPVGLTRIPYSGQNPQLSTRTDSLLFLIPNGSTLGNTINHLPGPAIDFFNYIDADKMKVMFMHDGVAFDKGGGVIRDTNYPPPPPNPSFVKYTTVFDQEVLTTEFKISQLEISKQGSNGTIAVKLNVKPGCNYKFSDIVVIPKDHPNNGISDMLLLVVDDHTSYNPTIDFAISDVDLAHTDGSPVIFSLIMWKETGPIDPDLIEWQYSMRKKGMIWIM